MKVKTSARIHHLLHRRAHDLFSKHCYPANTTNRGVKDILQEGIAKDLPLHLED